MKGHERWKPCRASTAFKRTIAISAPRAALTSSAEVSAVALRSNSSGHARILYNKNEICCMTAIGAAWTSPDLAGGRVGLVASISNRVRAPRGVASLSSSALRLIRNGWVPAASRQTCALGAHLACL